ncbi:MAG: protein of unknown function and CofD [Mycobacterium sp.]|nr:protein of unknown function and CofD [Mycobacterium sp.]
MTAPPRDATARGPQLTVVGPDGPSRPGPGLSVTADAGPAAAPAGTPDAGPQPAAVVALGGGHGLAATLRALRRLTSRLTAVVTVADNGGSSGRLRRELGAVPPGDLRMALAALTPSGNDVWARLLQHRFEGDSPLAGHPVGNLLLVGLTEVLGGSTADALAAAGRLLGLPEGTRVLPMSDGPLDIEADVAGLVPGEPHRVTVVRGQAEVALTRGSVLATRLLPPDPPACAAAVTAIGEADVVVLGPGSLFSSVVPHLLVPQLRDALVGARRVVYVLNLVPQPGETDGFSPAAHLRVLTEHAPGLRLDAVLADTSASLVGADGVRLLAELREATRDLGARLLLRPVARSEAPGQHDPVALAAAFAPLLGEASPAHPAAVPPAPGGS